MRHCAECCGNLCGWRSWRCPVSATAGAAEAGLREAGQHGCAAIPNTWSDVSGVFRSTLCLSCLRKSFGTLDLRSSEAHAHWYVPCSLEQIDFRPRLSTLEVNSMIRDTASSLVQVSQAKTAISKEQKLKEQLREQMALAANDSKRQVTA